MTGTGVFIAIAAAAAVGLLLLVWELRRGAAQPAAPSLSAGVAADAARDVIVAVDGDSRIVYANAAAEHVLGYHPSRLVGRDLGILMPEGLRQVHRDGMRRYLATGDRALEWKHVEMPGVTADGRVIALEISFAEHREGERRYFVGVLRDVTERRASGDMLALRCAVGEALASDAPAPEVMSRVVRAVCEAAHWDAGELWSLDGPADVLRLNQVWCGGAFSPSALMADARRLALKRGHGLPGRAWEMDRPAIGLDALAEPQFRRGDAARASGLRGGFAVPLRSGGRVVGVMAFYARRVMTPEPALLETLETLATPIGETLQRLNATAELRDHALRLRVLADLSLELAEVHPDPSLTFEVIARNTAERLGDLCLVMITPEGGGPYELVAFHHRRPDAVLIVNELRDTVRRLLEGTAAGQVVYGGRPLVVKTVEPEQIRTLAREAWPFIDRLGLRSLVVAPLKARGRAVGAILVARDESGKPYDEDDVLFLQQLAGRSALAMLNAQACSGPVAVHQPVSLHQSIGLVS